MTPTPQPDTFAASLTDEALAHRLTLLADGIRSFSVTERQALLREAAWRIDTARPLRHIA